MNTIKQIPQTLEFISSLSPVTRVLLALFARVPLLAPYELLIKPSWKAQIGLVAIFCLVVSVGAVVVSLFWFLAVLFGRSERFLFDASKRQCTNEFKTALNPEGQEVYSFDQIESLAMKVVEREGRSDTYDIAVRIPGKTEMKFGDFSSRSDAERYPTALQNMLTNRE